MAETFYNHCLKSSIFTQQQVFFMFGIPQIPGNYILCIFNNSEPVHNEDWTLYLQKPCTKINTVKIMYKYS